MRFGVIGLGSMGKRRVRDLSALGHEVVGFDVRPDRNEETQEMFSIATVADFEGLLRVRPDALVISTPPDQHVLYYKRSFSAGLPFFSELNILTPKVEWFSKHETETGVRTYPSATWHFYPPLAMLRQELHGLGLDQVNSVHYHYAGYLPQWHPWEDYKDFYAGSSRDTCAAREMVPCDLGLLCWVFGPVRAICCVQERRADWSTQIDDTYLLLLEFESGLHGTMTTELHQVAPFRELRVGCRRKSFYLDLRSHVLRGYDVETDSWCMITPPNVDPSDSSDKERIYRDEIKASADGLRRQSAYLKDWAADPYVERYYRDEIKAFVDDLEGRSVYPKSWADDRHLSNVLYAAEESSRRRAWVDVADAEDAYDGQSCVGG